MTNLIADVSPRKLQLRRTKIVATLGPATSTLKSIRELINAGVDVFRLNMSHGEADQIRQLADYIRRASKLEKKTVAILIDLCGPKIRTGLFKDGAIELKAGEEVIITTRQVTGENGLICSQYRKLHKDIFQGERILLDDGHMELRVKSIEKTEIRCNVIHGGLLKEKKGINLPDSTISSPSLTNKDKEDVNLAIELDADFLALSFVRHAEDVKKLLRYQKRQNFNIPVIAKIEKPEALTEIDEILAISYGIMVARGDLGIEIEAEKVPLIQEELIRRARKHNKPIIVATQMMESMIHSPRATRAEVADVANAARASTDAVMLSGETAIGSYPVQTVKEMDMVLREIEAYAHNVGRFIQIQENHHGSLKDALRTREAISTAAVSLAKDLNLQAIIVPTHSGTTVQVIAAKRPLAPIMGVSGNPGLARRFCLHWGIIPVFADIQLVHNWHHLLSHLAHGHCLKPRGTPVLMVAGFNDDPRLNEPSMKILNIISD
jgi:pyruvate kinase